MKAPSLMFRLFFFFFFEWLLQEGERGYLEGLASRYADLFRTHYGDVLEPLEELRRRETNASPRMPNTQLTTSHSQPIYVPGKYSVSKSVSFFRILIFILSFLFIFLPFSSPRPSPPPSAFSVSPFSPFVSSLCKNPSPSLPLPLVANFIVNYAYLPVPPLITAGLQSA